MTLYEINKDIEATLNAIMASVNEDGEVDEAYVHQLEDLQLQRDDKLEGIGCYIKNLRAEAVAIKAEEANLKARRTALENHAERLTNYVADMLGGEKWDKSPKVAYSFRKSERVVIGDESLIPAEYIKTKTETAPDLTAIKNAIKAGNDVAGARVVTFNNVQIK